MQNQPTSAHAPINGINIYYEIHGSGSIPLVLIHGGGSTIESSFGNLLPFLTGKLIAVELQAHGRTSDRDSPESFQQDADDVAALLKHLNIEKANILGFSNGASTALQIAIRHPQLVNKIVAIAGMYKRDGLISGFFEGMQNATLSDMPAPLQEAFLKVNSDKNGLQNMFNRDVERMQIFKDWADDDLRSINAPTLLMLGDRDVVTPEHTLKMSRLISGARLVILPGVHGELIGEVCAAKPGSKQPRVTATLVEEFLSA